MNLFPQYLDYNFVKVTIHTNGGPYVITNIQKKGLPPDNCGAHLESLDIETSVVGQNNPSDCGSKGTVTVIDYKDAVFNALRNNLAQYIASSHDTQYLPELEIEIHSFTGSRKWFGQITDWDIQFVGTTPSLTLTWSSIVQSKYSKEKDTDGFPYTGKQFTASKWMSTIRNNKAFSPAVIPEYPEGKKESDIKFIEGTGDAKDPKKALVFNAAATTGNQQVDAYNLVISQSHIDNKLLTGRVEPYASGNANKTYKYIIEYKDQGQNKQNTENGDTQTKLIFVQNGSYKYYKARSDGYVVIPMTSFSYNTKMNNLVLESRILNNPNGTVVQNMGNQNAAVVRSDTPASKSQSTVANDPKNSAIAVTFECYNVLNFSQNNTSEPVIYEVYNELGKKHVVSGKGTVNSCKFSVSGGVVKASISCTEVYNQTDVDEQGDGNVKDANGGNAGEERDGASEEAKAQNEVLYKDDTTEIPLSFDRTLECVRASNKFSEHVAEFMDNYALLKGTNKLLKKGFVDRLCRDGDFGLLSLLISVGNYGVEGDESLVALWGPDPVLTFPGFKTPYGASPTGKSPISPFDNNPPAGGLGIAHWDNANLYDIYTTCGFSADDFYRDNGRDKQSKEWREEIGRLIVAPHNSPTDPYVTVDWKPFTYNGLNRIKPVFSVKKPKMRDFDNGLKTNTLWTSWATEIVYNRSGGKYYFQEYLFKLWITKFWEPTLKNLRAYSVAKVAAPLLNLVNREPTLQDVVRISRAANSGTGYITKLTGLNPENQVKKYAADRHTERRRKQMLFCARTNAIIEAFYKGNHNG